MQIQNINLVQNFKNIKSITTKNIEENSKKTGNNQGKLYLEFEQKSQEFRNEEIQYRIAKANLDKINNELKTLTDESQKINLEIRKKLAESKQAQFYCEFRKYQIDKTYKEFLELKHQLLKNNDTQNEIQQRIKNNPLIK